MAYKKLEFIINQTPKYLTINNKTDTPIVLREFRDSIYNSTENGKTADDIRGNYKRSLKNLIDKVTTVPNNVAEAAISLNQITQVELSGAAAPPN